MRKLVHGIVDFRNRVRPVAKQTFERLALGQSPDALFIACSDSRVAINVFASTEPGDLFVVRNAGNIVSPAAPDGHSVADESEAAAGDRLSQENVLLQLQNLRSYSIVAEAERAGLRLHAFWFDIANAEVLVHDPGERRFVPLDEAQAERLSQP